jgi:hypothetical protein
MAGAANIILVSEARKLLADVVEAYTDYLKVKEHEITERQRIRDCLMAVTEKIKNDKAVCEYYIQETFKERARLYSIAEKGLDHAIAGGDAGMAKLMVDLIAITYNKNPLDGFDHLRSQLSGPGGIKNLLG